LTVHHPITGFDYTDEGRASDLIVTAQQAINGPDLKCPELTSITCFSINGSDRLRLDTYDKLIPAVHHDPTVDPCPSVIGFNGQISLSLTHTHPQPEAGRDASAATAPWLERQPARPGTQFPNKNNVIPNWGHGEAAEKALTGIHREILDGHGALGIVDEVKQQRAILATPAIPGVGNSFAQVLGSLVIPLVPSVKDIRPREQIAMTAGCPLSFLFLRHGDAQLGTGVTARPIYASREGESEPRRSVARSMSCCNRTPRKRGGSYGVARARL
jgi:hypothetical protein